MPFKIIRNANVKATYSINASTGTPVLSIFVSDGFHEFNHTFKPVDKINNMLTQMDLDTISKMFTGGTYMFFDGVLRDFRLGDYRGFIHSDESMKQLQEKIGFEVYENSRYSGLNSNVNPLFNRMRSRKLNGIHLGGEWDKFDINIPQMGDGGSFNNRLIYNYSLFNQNVTTSLEVERLVCENGMVAMSPLVVFESPIISDWESNLDVLSCQLKPKISEILRDRISSMGEQRASLSEVQDAFDCLTARINESESDVDTSRLSQMAELTNAEENLALYYKKSAFKAKQARYLDSDLTQFDVFNILTEAASHTYGSDANDNRIVRITSRIMFDGVRREKKVNPKVPESVNSDPNRAFFGDD